MKFVVLVVCHFVCWGGGGGRDTLGKKFEEYGCVSANCEMELTFLVPDELEFACSV